MLAVYAASTNADDPLARQADVAVVDGWSGILGKIGLSPKGSFLDHVRAGACKSFTSGSSGAMSQLL